MENALDLSKKKKKKLSSNGNTANVVAIQSEKFT